MIETTTVHIITWDGMEYDRNAVSWEIAQEKVNGNYKQINGVPTFDFR